MNKRGEIITLVSLKTYLIIIGILVLLYLGFYFFVLNHQKIIQIPKSCPEELNKTVVNMVVTDVYQKYPTTIYSEDFTGNKGSIYGYCRIGSEEGENINLIYCDTHQGYMTYTQSQTVDENGTIHNGEKWNVKIIVDKNSCNTYGKTKWGLSLYKCKITEIKCW